MNEHLRDTVVALAAALGLAATGCDGASSSTNRHELRAALEANPGLLSSYPPGRWRLAASETMNNTLLWMSHILVRHDRVSSRAPCTVFQWRVDTPRPERSRAEAFELALQIARDATSHPERFAELARQHSEDAATRARGGSLGGLRASDLELSEPLLDAVATLQPGQVSRVVETAQGFEILQRRAPPPELRVSGSHLVIGHDQVLWLESIGHPSPARSRAEALRLAESLFAELSANPDRFEELVQRHSEHPDKEANGDLGSWSVREPTPLSREVEVLQELAIGEVAPPLETFYGIAILRRTPERPRRSMAMEAIKLPFMPGDSDMKRSTLQRANELRVILEKNPERFDDFLAQYCCAGAEGWVEGREEPGLTAALAPLSMGEIVRAPVEQYLNIVIPRRLDPSRVPAPPATRLELPSPEDVDPQAILTHLPGRVIEAELVALAGGQSVLELSATEQLEVERLARTLGRSAGAGGESAAFFDFLTGVSTTLGEQRGAQYRQLLDARFEQLLLGQARSVLAKAEVP